MKAPPAELVAARGAMWASMGWQEGSQGRRWGPAPGLLAQLVEREVAYTSSFVPITPDHQGGQL